MTITYPPMLRGRGRGAPPKVVAEHRAGKFFLYADAPKEVRQAIGKRVLLVRALHHDGYVEIHGWCADFESIVPGQELPHYRWMYDTETFELTCVRESVPAPQETDHGLLQEDPAGQPA